MIEKWFEAFTLLKRAYSDDGLGARPPMNITDTPFQGALSFTAADEITAGGRAILQDKPTLLYDPDVTLRHGDRIRRDKDGSVYRVCAGTLSAPAYSGLRFSQVKVEKEVRPC